MILFLIDYPKQNLVGLLVQEKDLYYTLLKDYMPSFIYTEIEVAEEPNIDILLNRFNAFKNKRRGRRR